MVKILPANTGDTSSIPGSGGYPGGEMATHSTILARKSHGQRSLAGYSPWSPKESDKTEHSHVNQLRNPKKNRVEIESRFRYEAN